MPRARNPSRRDPKKTFRCIQCKLRKSGSHFYIKVKRDLCVVCHNHQRKTRGGRNRSDIRECTFNNYKNRFKYVVQRLANRKGTNTRFTYKWFATYRPMKFYEHLIEQLKKNDVKMEDYEITWKLGFVKTDGLTLREQFKYTNLLVKTIKQ